LMLNKLIMSARLRCSKFGELISCDSLINGESERLTLLLLYEKPESFLYMINYKSFKTNQLNCNLKYLLPVWWRRWVHVCLRWAGCAWRCRCRDITVKIQMSMNTIVKL
jgi:hypothetical protein